jgi:hypothetical protein
VSEDGYILSISPLEANFWSATQYQGAGFIGFGFGNAYLNNLFNDEFSAYTLQMSNFTNLSFAQPDYKPVTKTNTLTVSTTKPSSNNQMKVPNQN